MHTAACTSIVSMENNSEQSGHSTKADGESSVYSSNTGATSGKTTIIILKNIALK